MKKQTIAILSIASVCWTTEIVIDHMTFRLSVLIQCCPFLFFAELFKVRNLSLHLQFLYNCDYAFSTLVFQARNLSISTHLKIIDESFQLQAHKAIYLYGLYRPISISNREQKFWARCWSSTGTLVSVNRKYMEQIDFFTYLGSGNTNTLYESY